MTEVPDWDHDNPLARWRPEPGELARAGELWEMCLNDDPAFDETFTSVCRDVLTERNLPRVLAAILLHGRNILEGNCADRKLAQARLSADTAEAREEAVKEYLFRDDSD